MHPHVVQLVKHRRAFELAVRLKRPPRRLRRPLPRARQPDHIRLAYFSALRRQVLQPARALVNDRIISVLPSLVRSAGIARTKGMKLDADPGDVDDIMQGISVDFFDGLSDGDIRDIASEYGEATSRYQRGQLGAQLKAAVGVEVPIGDPHIRPMMETYTATNVALIKSIPTRYFQQVQSELMVDVSAGKRWEEIAEDLQHRYEVSEASARLIARDQVGKFLGSLNRVRQEDLGITGFIWRTERDNRVRESHWKLEGERFDWDDLPDGDDGPIEPGEEVNCRCWADPDVQSVVESLEGGEEEAA